MTDWELTHLYSGIGCSFGGRTSVQDLEGNRGARWLGSWPAFPVDWYKLTYQIFISSPPPFITCSVQKPPSVKFRRDLVEVGSARPPYPTSQLARRKGVTWSELTAWNSTETPAPPWNSTRKPKGSLMALPNSSPPPRTGVRLVEKWWTTLSNTGSGERMIGNQALQTGPQVSWHRGMYYLSCPLWISGIFSFDHGF